ncbi:hypothetical protein G9A89_015371 [Geosiphon pyriformis]|nr:hypothetical protein G9A89_015371 [Geosiphon pyriformis]
MGAWVSNIVIRESLSEAISNDTAMILNPSTLLEVAKLEKLLKGLSASVLSLLAHMDSIVLAGGLYTGTSAKTQFFQVSGINFLISRTVNTSPFTVLDGNFNEDRVKRCASFKKCLEVGLTNSLNGFFLSKSSIWSNLHGILRVIDYVFVSNVLASAIVGHKVTSVSKFFNTDHNIIEISVGLRSLVDTCLNNIYKQANKDQWKFKIKNADVAKWVHFKKLSLASLAMSLNSFLVAKEKRNLDGI